MKTMGAKDAGENDAIKSDPTSYGGYQNIPRQNEIVGTTMNRLSSTFSQNNVPTLLHANLGSPLENDRESFVNPVHFAVQRKSITAHTSHDHRHSSSSSSANNTGLPNTLRAGIENLSGYSMSDVRVHYNSSKPAQLQAHAYAQGNEIHMARGQEQHLPHEAWHVVQQKQGRVRATTQLRSKVNINNDVGLEREADVMGEKALNQSVSNAKARPLKRVSSVSVASQAKAIVQRVEVGARPFEAGYGNVLSDTDWFPKAKQYEQRLGAYASNHPSASRAMYRGLSKMVEVFEKFYRDEFAADKGAILKKLFFRDDRTSAGQVGLDLNVDKMLEVLGTGSIRERMTAFYNASYYGAGYGEDLGEGFKAVLLDIVHNSKWDESDALGLDTGSLREQGRYMGGWSRSAIHALVSSIKEEKAYNYSEDIFALGNLTYQTDDRYLTNTREIAESQKDRADRPDDEKAPHRKTPEGYRKLGVALSDSELAYLFPDEKPESVWDKMTWSQSDYRRDKTKDTPLSWEEGDVCFEISPENSWYKRIHDKLKMPVVAGVSGTTARMLNSFKWLNTGVNALEFRLAIMGWMLTSWDHSLYEILRGSHIAGVKGENEEESVKDVIRMYMNVPPLSIESLRTNVGEDGMFPHEFIYRKQTLEKNSDNSQAIVPGESSSGVDIADTGKSTLYNIFGAKKGGYSNLTEAHAIAIYTYTSGAHNILNSVMSFNMSELLAKKAIWGKLSNIVDYHAQRSFLADKQAKGTNTAKDDQDLLTLKASPVEWINVLTPKKESIVNVLGDSTLQPEQRDTYREKIFNPWLSALIDQIYPELHMHANMTVEGLSNLPSVDGATVWRGDWVSKFSMDYNEGETVAFDTFSSFSRKRSNGENFASQGSLSNKMLIKLDLTGKGGKDISGLSMFPNEEEVLLMPGAMMKINKASWIKIAGEDVWFVEAEEK